MAAPDLYVGRFAMVDLLAPLMVVLDQWSIVFPLGMYAAATLQLSQAYDLPFLHFVPTGFFWVALLGWVMAFAGAIRAATRGLRGQSSGDTEVTTPSSRKSK